jgi:phage tail-like protein
LLFQDARGRFLQLKLTLRGNGQATPRLRALRAYYPRFSYLQEYLPAVYREDSESASFLDRFLANPEGFLTALEDKIASVQMLFDYRSAPAEALGWLAGWFGVTLDPVWSEAKERVFIQHAMEFFQYRGTIRGIQMALRLALEDQPGSEFFSGSVADRRCAERFRIVEKFRTRRTPALALGDPTEQTGPREVATAVRWQPNDGAAELQRRFREYVGTALADAAQKLKSLRKPDDPLAATTAWAAFLEDSLRFLAEPDRIEASWQSVLQAKYVSIAALNSRYGTSYGAFSDVPVPEQGPVPSEEIEDWLQFALDNSKFPIREPADNTTAGVWRDFARSVLGFVPALASDDLEHWRDFLANRYGNITALNEEYDTNLGEFDEVQLPRDVPDEGALREDWNDFVIESVELGRGRREALWQTFLARRYRRIAELNAGYGTSWQTFAQVPVPRELPTKPDALQDWFQFEAVVMTMHQAAHKFTVLLPVSMRELNNVRQRQDRLGLARRLVELEKPAHTAFDVRFYWALLRVGEARLGVDTLVGLGSRAPELLTPLILDQSYLSESYLTPTPPGDLPGRFRVGADEA